MKCLHSTVSISFGTPKVGCEGRNAPLGSNSFIFMQFLVEVLSIIRLASPLGNPGTTTGPSDLVFVSTRMHATCLLIICVAVANLQMSAPVRGILEWTYLNRSWSSDVTSRYGWALYRSPCMVRSNALWVMVTWCPFLHCEQTDTTGKHYLHATSLADGKYTSQREQNFAVMLPVRMIVTLEFVRTHSVAMSP